MSSDKINITVKEIIAFIVIMGSMIGSLIYGYFLLKEDKAPAPAPMTCWEKYKDSPEQIAIDACEVHKE